MIARPSSVSAMDIGAVATAYLAHAKWQLGEVARARELIEEAVARAVESAHAPTLAIIRHFKVPVSIYFAAMPQPLCAPLSPRSTSAGSMELRSF